MAQLKMYWLPGTQIQEYPLPQGYSISNYKDESDKPAWVECCKKGLVDDDATAEAFDRRITVDPNIHPQEDVFFLDYNGEHIGTVTAFVNPETKLGDMHMVGIRPDFRGKGLSKYLCQITLNHLKDRDIRAIFLTTDEWRKSAVKSYLRAGFCPVEYDLGMQDRWEAMLEELDVESAPMLYEDGTPFRTVCRKSKAKKFKIGVLGAGRGQSMMGYCERNDHAQLVAVCDSYEPLLNKMRDKYGDSVACYTDFEEFLQHDMDAVVLANYANAHAPFAIRCMEAGKHVLSEVLPVQSLQEAVALIEAVERTGMIYAYAENYCYMPAPRKMRELYRKGVLGTFEYGEGEYMHNCEPAWAELTRADPNHWRNTMSAFFYCTHSLGPLLHITGLRPVRVTGFEAPFNRRVWRMGAKAAPFGVEMVTLENGAILKSVHGCGPSKNSIWYSIYGSKGRMESAREDDEEMHGVQTLYVNCDKNEADNDAKPVITDTSDALSAAFEGAGHGGSDDYVMYHFIQKLLGNRNAQTINIYEALDMSLPGLFAYRSVLNGGISMEIPNLRDPAERDKWRNDALCNDPAAGENYIVGYSKGEPDIPAENYAIHAAKLAEMEEI